MNTIEQILTVVSDRLKKADKKSGIYKNLKSLQSEINTIISNKADSAPNKDNAYLCSICGKIAVHLKQKKYCLECYDKYID